MNIKAGNTKSKAGTRAVKFLMGVFLTLFILITTVGLVVLVFYKSGEISLKAAALSKTPSIQSDEDEVSTFKSNFQYADTIAWDDSWVVYDGGVYEYNEDNLNFLLMGIDTSGELNSTDEFTTKNAGQADAIFLVSLNQRDKELKIIAIPRNSMVELEIYNEDKEMTGTLFNQICLQYGYAGGGELGLLKMKESASTLLYELPIHGACAISFDAIGTIVDMLGGVEVTIEDESLAQLNPVYEKGSRIKITKDNAVEYLRYRNINVLGSPTTRLERQKDFIKEIMKVAIDEIKANPLIVSDIYKAIVPYMNTDITIDEAVYIAKELIGYRLADDFIYQLEGEDKEVDFTRNDGSYAFYDDYYLDEESLKAVIFKVFYDSVVIDR